MSDETPSVVEQLLISAGEVQARVLAERARPYDVVLSAKIWDERQWEQVLTVLTTEASYIASLLNDQWPAALTQALNAINLSSDHRFALTDQSCPCADDAQKRTKAQSKRCVHIQAAEVALEQRIDAKPLLFFKLMGKDESTLFAELRQRRSEAQATDGLEQSITIPNEPYQSYVESSEPIARLLSEQNEPLFWRKEMSLHTYMRPVYRKVSERAKDIQKRYGLIDGRNE